MKAKFVHLFLFALGCLLLSSCNYEVALTAQPTRKIDERLLGDWVAVEKENAKDEMLHVRQLDDSTYVVSMDSDIYRVFHSDFAGAAFLSVQDLNPGNRKFLYYTWRLSSDGKQLTLQGVREEVVPEGTKGRAALQKLIKQNLGNSKLLGDEIRFARKALKF